MNGIHENQKKILESLLEHPEGQSLGELARHLGVTKTAAREHLLKVESLGYVSFQDTKGKVGRPRRLYQLSTSGHEAFPRQYSWLSLALLEQLTADMGSEGASRVMQRLGTKVADSMRDRFESAKSSAERLSRISDALNELGYRASLKQSDVRKGAVIEATNCVYHSVAKEHPELCKFDIKFIERASGGLNIKLESCIARGGSVCRFCLKK